jgi:hypothetical protein
MDGLREENLMLRKRIMELDETLSNIRALTLAGQGIEKGKSLGKREIADRGLR